MPLSQDALRDIRFNLEEISDGKRARLVTIGRVTDKQLAALNKERKKRNLPEVESGEVRFIGRHIYESRIVRDGYTIEDVVTQITRAMDEASQCKSATSIENGPRDDGYGNSVRDRAVFECTSRRPHLELFSVIALGDTNKPKTTKRKEPPKGGPSP